MHVKHGLTLLKILGITNLLTKNKLVNFQTLVFKQILGISRKTTNLSVLLELGKYPITVNMKYQAIKYFTRFPSLSKERLLYETYAEVIKTHSTGEQIFVTYVIDLLNNLGLSIIWRDQLSREGSCPHQHTHKEILTRLTDIFSQNAFDHIQNTNSGKLKFLRSMKNTYNCEMCLKINNFENRRALTKLRTSNHRLAIETGGWTKIERENLLCKQCTQNEVEDEIHFLFKCQKYTDERLLTFQFIKSQCNVDLFYEKQQIENLKLLFISDHLSSLNTLGKFVKNSFKIREC